MQNFLSPLCLVLCLALLVTAFAVLATDAPEPSVQLHAARVEGDEAYEEVLEENLQHRIWLRRGLIAVLFFAAVASGVAGFYTIGGSRRP
ncbi:MAG: hypothetical protein ACODAD_08985 [Planctomycetota bacterium]